MNQMPDVEQLANQEYKAGFVTDIEADDVPAGLDESTIRLISAKKNEPAFLLQWRLKAFRQWLTMKEPHWPNVKYPPIDYQDIIYYSAPKGPTARYARIEDVPPEIRDYICYEHVVIVGGLGLGEEALAEGNPMGYRIHQWEKTDYGVVGKSSAFGTRKKEDHEAGKVWAAHCIEEVGNWGAFLPQLYTLFKVVKNTKYNPFADLSVEGKGREAKYKYIK